MGSINFENSEISKRIANYRLPRYDELMKFDLFMNQLTDILDEYLSPFLIPGEAKALTPSMINNYVFKQVILPPDQKKYSRKHVIHLLVIGILKQVLSLSDIAELISKQIEEYPIDIAYNYFCNELEKALRVVFEGRDFSEIEKTQPTKVTPLSRKIRSAVLSFANKIYVKQSIYFDKTQQK
ncbi:MAG: DUF1836 domain-containing protein [bacterium]|nr:DUF1836 domain-containing protein [bacterium]